MFESKGKKYNLAGKPVHKLDTGKQWNIYQFFEILDREVKIIYLEMQLFKKMFFKLSVFFHRVHARPDHDVFVLISK